MMVIELDIILGMGDRNSMEFGAPPKKTYDEDDDEFNFNIEGASNMQNIKDLEE